MTRERTGPSAKSQLAVGEPPGRVDFLVLPKFQLLTLSLAIETLRIANRAAGRRIIDWRVVSDGVHTLKASNGLAIASDSHLQEIGDSRFVFVCAAFDVDAGATPAVLSWLRRQDRRGAVIGGLDAGPIVLAKAGLLGTARATLHWESIPAFRERFPGVDVSYRTHEIDGRRVTSAGSLATFELLLKLLTLWFGDELARRTAEMLVWPQGDKTGASQQLAEDLYPRYRDRRVRAAIVRMRETLDDPLDIDELSRRGNLSSRQLIRLFKQHVGRTPQRHYLELRIARADQLLKETTIPLSEVAVATGFPSASSFSHCYRRVRGVSPTVTRSTGFGPVDIEGP